MDYAHPAHNEGCMSGNIAGMSLAMNHSSLNVVTRKARSGKGLWPVAFHSVHGPVQSI